MSGENAVDGVWQGAVRRLAQRLRHAEPGVFGREGLQ